MSRVVVVGGFTTGKKVLEPVAEAFRNRFRLDDADVFTFTEAMDNLPMLEKASKGQTVLTHSAGLVAVANCVSIERLIATNPPEPRSQPRLLASAANKSGNLIEMVARGPHREGALRVLASNAFQAIAHFGAHARQLAVVSKFSATEHIDIVRSAQRPAARIDTDKDEFFGPYALQAWNGEKAVLAGCHDQILIDPSGFIKQLDENILQ